MVTRRLQKQLDNGDIFIEIKYFPWSLEVTVGMIEDLKDTPIGERIMLSSQDIGKWLTLEMDLLTKTSRYYLSETKI